MAIAVRIPTILRNYTGGEKQVEASGTSLGSLIDDLDAQAPGLKGRLVTDDGALHRFVNVYVNDEDVRLHRRARTPGCPTVTRSPSCPRCAGG